MAAASGPDIMVARYRAKVATLEEFRSGTKVADALSWPETRPDFALAKLPEST
jgi:hypothetical protein